MRVPIYVTLASALVLGVVAHGSWRKRNLRVESFESFSIKESCVTVRKLISISSARSKNGTLVDIMPDFGDFIIAECSSDGDKCHGVDNERFISKCETRTSLFRTMVRGKGTEQYRWDFIRLPAHCVCLIKDATEEEKSVGEDNWADPLDMFLPE